MSDFRRSSIRIGLVALTLVGLAACGSIRGAGDKVVDVVTPYKIDVVQGNVVTREQLAALQIGMPRMQVRDVLGTSLLASVFHADRWDYVFTLKRQGGEPQSRKVTVFFKNDLLERIEADDLPSESEFVSTLKSPVQASGALPALEASADSLKKYPVPAKPAPAPASIGVAPATYPPLESTPQ